jgi:cytosine/adenosine deaminase-related metal-dependent hydrolase
MTGFDGRGNWTRRRLLAGATAFAATGLALGSAHAQEQKKAPKTPRPKKNVAVAKPKPVPPLEDPNLPPRGNYVIRNAYVMSMEKGIGDIPEGHVQVRNGEIVAVDEKVDTSGGATVIDGRGMIVLPGFVETHWHMWNSLLRGMSGEKIDYGYFRTTAQLGAQFTPDDIYQGTRLATLEAINSGITSVHNWAHNVRSPDFARADLRALKEAGIRARFSYGPMQGHDLKQTIDLADLEKLKNDWAPYSNGPLLTLGMAWRGQGGNQPANAVPEAVWRAEFEAAQRLGLPVSVHSSGSKTAVGQIAGLDKAGMLKNVQIIHAVYATPDEIRAMKEARATISVAPTSELRIGFGLPPVSSFLDADIPVGLSIDTVELVGNADMFAIMKTVQGIENGRAENEFKISARRVLELATIEGARSMGIDDKVGSLKPGKRADLIMVNTRAPNLGVFGHPAVMMVTAAQPGNVDTVMVDGRILKKGGKLTHLNADRIVQEANDANAALRKRAKWW